MLLRFHNVSFSHTLASVPLFNDVAVQFSPGWTGIIGANGTGKTTLLRLACGFLLPQKGHIQSIGKAVLCVQRTDKAPLLFADFLAATDKAACRIHGQLDIGKDWAKRWPTLSHGERKRAQIATALWQSPDVLAIDEPTNHIDAQARHLLAQALMSFRGIGLLVSHDRDLLDALCHTCLFVEPPQVTTRPGGYTQAADQARQERESAWSKRKQTRQALDRLEGEVRKRRSKATQADKKRSKRGIARKDHDAKEKINLARNTGKDGQAGRLTRQLKGRAAHLRQDLEQLTLDPIHRAGVWLPDSRSRKSFLFNLPTGSIPLGGDRNLHHPALSMAPDDRIGLIGPNGAGKTTLIRHLLENVNVSREEIVYMPQEIDTDDSRAILSEVKRLPREDLGRVMTIVSRLGSRPERLLETGEPSPGEVRKIHLALGIIRAPHLIVLDEPTNHMDLVAIECLETALSDCPCGLLMVSHDLPFLRRLARKQWTVKDGQLEIS